MTDKGEHEEDAASKCKFTEVIGGLNSFYNDKRMKDISTAFCFMCLLHLANENGLKINMNRREGSNMDELEVIRGM